MYVLGSSRFWRDTKCFLRLDLIIPDEADMSEFLEEPGIIIKVVKYVSGANTYCNTNTY